MTTIDKAKALQGLFPGLEKDGEIGEQSIDALYNFHFPSKKEDVKSPESTGVSTALASTLALHQKLIDIARKDEGKTEVSKNQAPWILPFWPATSYPDGYKERAPYCAAACCRWVQLWLQDEEVLKAFKMTAAQAEKWRCKSASAFGWKEWAGDKGATILKASDDLRVGDIAVYEFSHIGIVVSASGTSFKAIEANTGAAGERDGEGCFIKSRNRGAVRAFVRLLA